MDYGAGKLKKPQPPRYQTKLMQYLRKWKDDFTCRLLSTVTLGDLEILCEWANYGLRAKHYIDSIEVEK